MCFSFLQVNAPLTSKEEVASEALDLATDPNSTLALNLAGKDYQAAANAIYSTISILNMGIHYVRISFIICMTLVNVHKRH